MLQMKKLSVALALCGAAALNATAHAADIKVGIALDLSGPFSALGAEARDGFELAIEKLGGKLGGQPAEFIRNDFGGNPEQANQLVARFLQRDGIDFFTGPIGSNAALAVGPALFAAKVPYLSANPGPSAYAGEKCNPYFFAQYQNDTYDEAAGKVANEKGYQNVVLIAPNYPAGKDHLNGFKRLYKGGVKDEIDTKLGQIDYAAEIAQIRAAKPDAVFFFLPGAMGDQLRQAVRRRRPQGRAADRPRLLGRRGRDPGGRRADARRAQHRALDARPAEPGQRRLRRRLPPEVRWPLPVGVCGDGLRHADGDGRRGA